MIIQPNQEHAEPRLAAQEADALPSLSLPPAKHLPMDGTLADALPLRVGSRAERRRVELNRTGGTQVSREKTRAIPQARERMTDHQADHQADDDGRAGLTGGTHAAPADQTLNGLNGGNHPDHPESPPHHSRPPPSQPAAPKARPAPERKIRATPATDARGPGFPALSGRTATRVIREAANILEQELAAGIHATRGMEERFINVQQLRSRDAEEVMQRFRRDAHDVVDIVLDVLTVFVDSTSGLAERSFSSSGVRPHKQVAASSGGHPSASKVPTLSVPEPLTPGQTAELAISVDNDSMFTTETITFRCSDLMSSGGGVIASGHIRYMPNHLKLGPQQSQRIAIQIHIPVGCSPGLYCGMFQAHNFESVQAALMVEVRGVA